MVNIITRIDGKSSFSIFSVSNPFNTGVNGYYANIASYTAPASARKTEIEYAASVATTTPAGIYSTVFTYVATANF